MFRVIGAAIVYGFATYGFLVWFKKKNNDKENETMGHQECGITG